MHYYYTTCKTKIYLSLYFHNNLSKYVFLPLLSLSFFTNIKAFSGSLSERKKSSMTDRQGSTFCGFMGNIFRLILWRDNKLTTACLMEREP